MGWKTVWIILAIILLAFIAVLVVGSIGNSRAEKVDAVCDIGFSIGEMNFCYQWTQTNVEHHGSNNNP